jgi:deazaflavin-dependent oxidoreductase (nitroreductase family)
MKHQIVHTLQKYFLNPPIKIALAMSLPLPGYALLETKGRKTGKPRRTPVGDGRIGNQFWLVAEHGMKAGYVRNIEQDPHVRLKLREGLRYHWHTGSAYLLSDDDPRERQRWLASHLPSSAGNARAVRLFGTRLLTVRIDLDG